MIIELSIHDIELKEIELKQCVNDAVKYKPNSISVYPHYLKTIKKHIEEQIELSCPIDYPLGKSDIQTRQTEIIFAIKNGASRVDVVMPTLFVINSKYDKLREDIKQNIEICNHHNVDIRYMLEYRIFNHTTLAKISGILKELGIPIVYTSTGYMLDDIIDNTIAGSYLAKKTQIKTIINGAIWHKEQIKTVVESKPYGIRLKNIHSLYLIHEQKIKR